MIDSARKRLQFNRIFIRTELQQLFVRNIAVSYTHLVSLEHIILALLTVKSTVSTSLKDAGMTEKELRNAISELRKGEKVTSQSSEDTYQSLEKYAINLNEAARSGKLDPVIGRDEEIRRVLQILSRRTKNNQILIGEPGTGKTAIVEGLAHRILRGDVPENLKNKQVYSLDMGALVAGAKYKGEFEERLKSVVNEVKKSEGDIMLFIDCLLYTSFIEKNNLPFTLIADTDKKLVEE